MWAAGRQMFRKALCQHQEAETSGLCLVFGIEYITDIPLIFVEPKDGFATAWDCLFVLFLAASKADQPCWFSYKIYCFRLRGASLALPRHT